jgi:small subunit ribosomal protein S20
MPNIKSAIKRVRVSKAKHDQNKAKKSELKTVLRRYREKIDAKSEDMEATLKQAIKKIDQAAAKNLIHKNTAARKKSRIMKAYNALSSKQSV